MSGGDLPEARGDALARIAANMGVQRRLFETDRHLRRRLERAGGVPPRGYASWRPGRLYWVCVVLAALLGLAGIVYQVERDLAVWRHCR